MHDTDIFQLMQSTDSCLFAMAHTDKTTDNLTFEYFKKKFHTAIWQFGFILSALFISYDLNNENNT